MKKLLFVFTAIIAGLILGSCNKILEEMPIRLEHSATPSEIYLGESSQLSVRAVYENGTKKDVTSDCTFDLFDSDDAVFVSLKGNVIKAVNDSFGDGRDTKRISVIYNYERNVGILTLNIKRVLSE